jgi:hypothetical protein
MKKLSNFEWLIMQKLSSERMYYLCIDCYDLHTSQDWDNKIFNLSSFKGTPFYKGLRENYKIKEGLCMRCNNNKLQDEVG